MRAWLALLLIFPLAAGAQIFGFGENGGKRDRAAESKALLPEFPKPENYLPFEVSATTPFSFFVDEKSISIVADNVVRYSLIAKSADGALNVSYEGLRCGEHEFRIYAVGQSDKTWTEVQNSNWKPLRLDPRNAQRVVLYSDFFCPLTGFIADNDEAVRSLRNGGNPRSFTPGY
ncbi:MAG: CNP1-like family protein [Burkholderiales bacterium]|nr:CNP1-like family protein [Burkholderiales bacterium]